MSAYSYDERDVFIRGKNVLLKALTENDVRESGWYGWFNDEQTTHFLDHHYFPNTLENQLQFLGAMQAATNKLQLGILTRELPHIVGVVSLNSINLFHRSAEVSMVIGEKKQRSRNVGLEAMALILKHGFFKMNLQRIWAGQDVGLEKWRASLTTNLGFQVEGTMRRAFYNQGEYRDVVMISVLREDFVRALNENIEIASVVGYTAGTFEK